MASLICTKGQYAGANFTINGSLSIGRDPKRCQLVISNANGISSMHCEIRAGANGITLTDMGSTNGTFVGGRKLSANEIVTLNNGDSFYLADGGNEFRIAADQPQFAQPVYQQPQPQYAPPPQQYAPPPQQYAQPQQPAYQQPQPQYAQQSPSPIKKKWIPLAAGALGLVLVIVVVAVLIGKGNDGGSGSTVGGGNSNRSSDERTEGGGKTKSDESTNVVLGKWKLVSYTYTLEEGGGLAEPVSDEFIIEFRADGEYGGTYSGTYKIRGSTLTMDDEDFKFKIPEENTNRLILTQEYYEETSAGTIIEQSMLFDRIS